MFLKKSFLKFWGDMPRLKTKQAELIIHHMSQKLRETKSNNEKDKAAT